MDHRKYALSSDSSAITSWLGYVSQEYRLVERLLKAKRTNVLGFELLDDVEEQTENGLILEQDKVSVTSRNIVGNKSKDLWNTLSNWVNLIKEDKVDVDSTIFLLFTNKKHTSDILEHLINATNHEEAQKAFGFIAGIVQDPSDSIKEFVENFLSLDDRKYALIANFQYVFGSGSVRDDLMVSYKELVTSVSDEYEEILHEILGWTRDMLFKLAEKREPTLIQASAFGHRLGEIESKYRQKSILDFLCQRASDDEEVSTELSEKNVYVSQLEIVNASKTEIEEAVISKLEARDAISDWTVQGHIQESSYQTYSRALKNKWSQQKGITFLKNKNLSDEERGYLLYLECQRETEGIKLEHKNVGDFFSKGSLQELAKKQDIGWHPDYTNKLKEKTK